MGCVKDGVPVFERLLLHPRDYGFDGPDPGLDDSFEPVLELTVRGVGTELTRVAILNGGFYLWRAGVTPDLLSGFRQAKVLLETGQVQAKCEQVKGAISTALTNHLSIV
jgi:anthranilate phosphoribosyltransferase